MSRQYRSAGQSTRDMAEKRYRMRLRFVLPFAAVVIVILVVLFNSSVLGIGGLGLIGLAVVARLAMDFMEAKANRIMKEERRAIRGAEAEEKIGSLLDTLGEDYLVIHDVESPYGNIDHVVISKQSEAFLIETKGHGGGISVANGQLLLNGHEPEKDFVAQTLRNTYWLRDRIREEIGLDVWITPILVFTNAFVERMMPIKGVTVVNKRYLIGALRRRAAIARSPALWEGRERILAWLRSPAAGG